MNCVNHLNSTSSVRAEGYTAASRVATPPASAPVSPDRSDRVELSDAARALASQPTPIRQDLVSRVRDELARGVYDSDSKLDQAITELAKDLTPLNDVYG